MAKVRDAYCVIGNYDTDYYPTFGEKLYVRNSIAYRPNGRQIGLIVEEEAKIRQMSDYILQLRKDNIIPKETQEMVFLVGRSMKDFDINQGSIVFVKGDYVVLDLGKVVIDEEDEDEATYTLTEKGLKLLAEMQKALDEKCCECCDCPEERKENTSMENLFGNLGFGKLQDYRFKLSMNGIAVEQPNGKYVVYNKDNNEFIDVSNTLFDIKDALFLLPAVEVNPGDTVIHERKPYYITDTANGEIKAVSYEDCTQTVLIPKSTMFGIKYFNKVYSMFGDNFAATGDLFSNPMILMALMDGKNNDLSQLMLLNSLNNGDLGSNPMALAMMLKGDKGDNSLSTLAMISMFSNGTNPFTPKKSKTKTESK